MESTQKAKLLLIVVNAGYAEEVIETAREAGAKGATVVNARGTGKNRESFLGITVDAEKEIILSIM
ncbi:MAG: P-II family nitrogen regulator, partial [Defluviitaleaceae bacterium]|nr:P-II family nitrogen regulator [Defluviitaleaceae bacterium]